PASHNQSRRVNGPVMLPRPGRSAAHLSRHTHPREGKTFIIFSCSNECMRNGFYHLIVMAGSRPSNDALINLDPSSLRSGGPSNDRILARSGHMCNSLAWIWRAAAWMGSVVAAYVARRMRGSHAWPVRRGRRDVI